MHVRAAMSAIGAIVLYTWGAYAGSWATLDFPGAQDTYPCGVSAGTVVGRYDVGGNAHGFTWDGANFATADYPGTGSGHSTWLNGISGSTAVGNFGVTGWTADGRLYNLGNSTWSTLSSPYPQYPDLYLLAMSGNNIVGKLWDGNQIHGASSGVLYDGTSWSLISPPGAVSSEARAIQGSTIIGSYSTDWTHAQGFIYNGLTLAYTTFDVPGSTSTCLGGISGGNMVGWFIDAGGEHGFLYDGTTFTTLDYPGATRTDCLSIDGNTIVGYYTAGSGSGNGFTYTIPEPSSLSLVTLAALCLWVCRRCNRPR
jgi:hypothetical protein